MAAAAAANAATALGGRPVIALRVSEADPRQRHRGLSHHAQAVLDTSLVEVTVPNPQDAARLARGLRRPAALPHGPRPRRGRGVLRLRVCRWHARARNARVIERRLGPVVGLGTWNTFETDAELADEVVSAAADAGVRLFDTSPMYRGAEQALAAALDGIRDDVTVATKIWADSAAEGREQFQRQLEWYEGRIDVEQVHNLAAWREQLEWLEAEREAGRVGRIGVTHYEAVALRRARDRDARPARRVRAAPVQPARARVRARAAAARGRARHAGDRDAAARRRLARPPRASPQAELDALGCATWAEALLRWALSDERVDVVIPGDEGARARAARTRAPATGRCSTPSSAPGSSELAG